MNPFRNESLIMADALKEAREKIEAVDNDELSTLKARIMGSLKRDETALRFNAEEDMPSEKSKEPEPLRSMFGKKISEYGQQVRDVNKPIITGPTDAEKSELRAKVDEVYLRFADADPTVLLDTLDELIIRGVAKKAGMLVTENDPARITLQFVEKIVAEVKAKLGSDAAQSAAAEPNQDNALKELRSEADLFVEQVDALYEIFPTLTPAELFDSYGDLLIRGVAKKAGMDVTEDRPAELNSNFIGAVKKAIKRKAEIEKAGNAGNNK